MSNEDKNKNEKDEIIELSLNGLKSVNPTKNTLPFIKA